jgi:hypothetical protein
MVLRGGDMNQIKQIAFTVLRVFSGVVLAALAADWVNLVNFNWADWKPIILAAVSAAVVVIINALNPKDVRYGINSTSS